MADTTTRAVANAMRTVSAKLQWLFDDGKRSARIDAYDLIETMLAVADELDPADCPDHCIECGTHPDDLARDAEPCGRCGR